MLRGQKPKERVKRKGLLFLALRGPAAAAAFIIQMLQHDTELIQPLVNSAARGPVQTLSWLVQRRSESGDPFVGETGKKRRDEPLEDVKHGQQLQRPHILLRL